MVNRLEQLVDSIFDYLEECKPVKLQPGKIAVNKEELIEQLEELKQRTPDEIRRYQKIIANRDSIIASAEEKAEQIIEEAKAKGVNISVAVEAVATQEFSNEAQTKVFPANAIPSDWEGIDAGPASLENWKKIIEASKTILWNGPVGVFEIPNFAKGTLQIAQVLADVTAAGAYTLVGGGDSVAAVTQMGFADKVSYVSTGGGAMLEAIEGKELPGIAAVRE